MSTIYIHWPFCLSKCAYCDFNSYKISSSIDYAKWLSLYKKVLLNFRRYGDKITSVYWGGGTPSLLPSDFIANMLSFIKDNFNLIDNAEITIEVNPASFDIEKFKDLKKCGVNRISIGIQSIYDSGLKTLGRLSHKAQDSIDCVNYLSQHFDNVSIDLIYNRPSQTPQD